MLVKEIIDYVNRSVLCWLATVSETGMPNVSPKEIFDFYRPNSIIVANIASPQTVKNIAHNANVCISFIDILVQKGLQIKGTAEIIEQSNSEFNSLSKLLVAKTQGKFPINSITKISIKTVKPIIAPSYIWYPETTEKEQIECAKKTYGF